MGIQKSIWGVGGSAGEVPINDAGAAADEVWSSEKISDGLAGLDKYTRAEVDALIADIGGAVQVKTSEGNSWTSIQTINFPSSSNYTENVTRTVELAIFQDPVGFINFNVDLPTSNGVRIWDLSAKGMAYEPQYFWRVVADFSEKTHAHTESDITDLNKYTQAEVDALLSGLAAPVHDHFVAPAGFGRRYRHQRAMEL